MTSQNDFDDDYTRPLAPPKYGEKWSESLPQVPDSLSAKATSSHGHVLHIKENNTIKTVIVLDKPYYSLGRGLDNAIVLNSRFVSKHHASIIRLINAETKQSFFRVVDGDSNGKPSLNGIIINGVRCQTHDLVSGDILTFGDNIAVQYLQMK